MATAVQVKLHKKQKQKGNIKTFLRLTNTCNQDDDYS